MLGQRTFRLLVLCQMKTINTVLCNYYSPLVPSVLSNELNSIAFPIRSWLFAHLWDLPSDYILPSVFLTLMLQSSVQLPAPEPSVSFCNPAANPGSANPINSSCRRLCVFHYLCHCLCSACRHLLTHFNSLHAGLPFFSPNPLEPVISKIFRIFLKGRYDHVTSLLKSDSVSPIWHLPTWCTFPTLPSLSDWPGPAPHRIACRSPGGCALSCLLSLCLDEICPFQCILYRELMGMAHMMHFSRTHHPVSLLSSSLSHSAFPKQWIHPEGLRDCTADCKLIYPTILWTPWM